MVMADAVSNVLCVLVLSDFFFFLIQSHVCWALPFLKTLPCLLVD